MSEPAKWLLAAGLSVVCVLILVIGERSLSRILGVMLAYGVCWGIVGLPARWPVLVLAVGWVALTALLVLELYDRKVMAETAATGVQPRWRRHQRMTRHADEDLLATAILLHDGPDGTDDGPSQTLWGLVESTPRWQEAGVTPQNAAQWLEASQKGWRPGNCATPAG